MQPIGEGDTFDTLRQVEEHNFTASRQALGNTYGILDQLLGLYLLLGELVRDSEVAARDEIVASIVFMQGAQYALVKGILELMRGHAIECFGCVRNALELAGFADIVRRNPGDAMVWVNVGTGDPSDYRRYRRAFTVEKSFPNNDPLMRLLYDRFDICSKRLHGSLHSYATRLRVGDSEPPGGTEIRYGYVSEFREASDLVRMFLWVIQCHRHILTVFGQALADAVRHAESKWEERCSAFDASFEVQALRWKPAIAPPCLSGRSTSTPARNDTKGEVEKPD